MRSGQGTTPRHCTRDPLCQDGLRSIQMFGCFRCLLLPFLWSFGGFLISWDLRRSRSWAIGRHSCSSEGSRPQDGSTLLPRFGVCWGLQTSRSSRLDLLQCTVFSRPGRAAWRSHVVNRQRSSAPIGQLWILCWQSLYRRTPLPGDTLVTRC